MTDRVTPSLTGAAAVFDVRDVALARDFYRDRLGFAVTFEWGAPLDYVCLCRDDVQLHVRATRRGRTAGGGTYCVFVRDVDALHAELVGRGAAIPRPPETFPYGMREFELDDPDGNRLVFGMGVETGQ